MISKESSAYHPPRTRLGGLLLAGWSLELAITFALFFVGGVLAYIVTTSAPFLFFYQNQTPEIIYAACGHGYRHPGELEGPIIDFVMLRTPTFNCADLQGLDTLKPPTLFATLQMYLGRTIAVVWQGPQLTYAGLWPLTAAAYAVYSAGIFVLLRLFFPLLPATVGAGILTFSPIALSVLTSFRDFSKAPFAIWAIVLFLLMVRAKSFWSGMGWAVVTGAVVGIGAGFRVDLLILAAVIVVSLLAVWSFKAFLHRALRAAVFIAIVALVAQPVFDIPDTGGNGTIISQGLSEPFRRFLGMEGASYILGNAYSDELTMSSIAAVERERRLDWDAKESKGYSDVSQVLKVSLPHVLAWLPYFAADFATQGLKSASWVTAMPALIATQRQAWDPGGPVRSRLDPSQWLGPLYDTIGQPWLIGLTLVGLLLFAWREAALRPDAVTSTLLMMAGLLAMPVAQFSVRHIFHLEFFWVIALLTLFSAWPVRGRLRSVTPWFARGAVAVLILGASIYGALIAYQDRNLPAEFANLLALPREPAAFLDERIGEGGKPLGSFAVAVPDNRREIIRAPQDALTDLLPLRGLAWDVRAQADRFLLTLDGCAPGTYAISAIYDKRAGIWQPLDYTVQLDVKVKGPTQVLLPAFYRPTQNFARVTVTPLLPGCDAHLERIVGYTPLPPHLIAWFPPDWRDSWKRRGFGGFGSVPP